MSLFQNAIVKNYLKGKEDKIDSAYAKFTAFFHNPERQQNIRDSNRRGYAMRRFECGVTEAGGYLLTTKITKITKGRIFTSN